MKHRECIAVACAWIVATSVGVSTAYAADAAPKTEPPPPVTAPPPPMIGKDGSTKDPIAKDPANTSPMVRKGAKDPIIKDRLPKDPKGLDNMMKEPMPSPPRSGGGALPK